MAESSDRTDQTHDLLCSSSTLFCFLRSSMSCWCDVFRLLMDWMYSAAFFRIWARDACDRGSTADRVMDETEVCGGTFT